MTLNTVQNSPHNSLIPTFESDEWQSWSPSDSLSPQFKKTGSGKEWELIISSDGDSYRFGKWICTAVSITSEKTYRFNVEYLPRDSQRHRIAVSAVLSWLSADHAMLERNYAEGKYDAGGGWTGLYSVYKPPSNAAYVTVELHLKCSKRGSVQWRRPALVETAPVGSRKVTVCTTWIRKFSTTPEENLQKMLKLLDSAGRHGPDIICLTETPYNNETGLAPAEVAQSIPGRLTDHISRKAVRYKSYVIFSMIEKNNGFLYNTAVLLDRNGKVFGTYRKTHLPLGETEEGLVPGTDYPVFDTDFGRIGIMICWDHWFPETARILRLKGAEIIFVPSQRNGVQDKSNLIQSQARAVDNGVYLVVSGVYGRSASTIIGPDGRIIGKVPRFGKDYIHAEIDLNKRYLTPHLSVGCSGEGKTIYIQERRTDTYGMLLEP